MNRGRNLRIELSLAEADVVPAAGIELPELAVVREVVAWKEPKPSAHAPHPATNPRGDERERLSVHAADGIQGPPPGSDANLCRE